MTATETVPVIDLYVLCSYPMRPDAIAASDTCQQLADTAVKDADGNSWWRCPAHRGAVRPDVTGEVVTEVPRAPGYGDHGGLR